MTARDRYVIAVLALVGLLGAFWFMGLSPKRERLAKLDKDIKTAQESVETAEQEKAQFAQAQVEFPTLYASVGRLGKAVPANDDVPSLLVQLNHAASGTGVDFRSIELKRDESAEAATPAASPPAAATPGAGEAASGGSAAAGEPGAAGGDSAAAASSPPATGATGAEGATPAEPGAAAAAPTLQPLPFEYKFRGNFFQLKKMLGALADLVESRNREVAISGRLITVEGFTLKQGKVTVLATSYLLPAGQSLLGGASPAGPAGVDPNAPQPASAGSAAPAPPAATVTAP